jgi:hypothetical protein
MKLKTLLVSVVILAALSAGAFLLRRPPPPPAADARIGQPLAEAGAIEKAAKLRLSDGGKNCAADTPSRWDLARAQLFRFPG